MKINRTGEIDQIKAYTAQLKKTEVNEVKHKANGQVHGDRLEISSEARKMQNYKVMLDKTPAVREDLVASLKQSIQNGSYRPDSEKIAAGILEEKFLDKVK